MIHPPPTPARADISHSSNLRPISKGCQLEYTVIGVNPLTRPEQAVSFTIHVVAEYPRKTANSRVSHCSREVFADQVVGLHIVCSEYSLVEIVLSYGIPVQLELNLCLCSMTTGHKASDQVFG